MKHKDLNSNGIQIEGQCSAIDYIIVHDNFVVAFSNPAHVALIDKKGKIYKRISKGFLEKTLLQYPTYI